MKLWWQQRQNTTVAQLRARCESCNWSGPLEHFDLWSSDKGTIYICCDPRCQTAIIDRALEVSGYTRLESQDQCSPRPPR